MEATATQPEAKTHVDAYSLVTDKIIEQLTKGVVPWQKHWNRQGPINLITKKPYDGINALLLNMEDYADNHFLTFEEVNRVGGKVIRGSKGHTIVKWEKVAPAAGDNAKADEFRLRYYTVFNIAQCEKLPENLLPAKEVTAPAANFKLLVDSMHGCPKIKNDAKEPSYDVVEDTIHVPRMRGPKDDQQYYAQLFRQLIHSTGHDSRLVRKGMVEMSELASEPLFSKEDLIADLGLCFLLSAIGFGGRHKFTASYISGWIVKLQQNKKLMVIAAGQAQKAVNYILNVKERTDKSSQENG